MKAIAIALLSGLFSACAGPRAPVVSPPASAAVARVPTAVQTASNLLAVNQSYLKRGYQAVQSNGEVLYCRSEALTGSLFRSTVCHTDAQMQAADQNRRRVVDEIENAHGGECTIMKCN